MDSNLRYTTYIDGYMVCRVGELASDVTDDQATKALIHEIDCMVGAIEEALLKLRRVSKARNDRNEGNPDLVAFLLKTESGEL